MSNIPGKKTAFQGRAKQILIRVADNGPLTTTDLVDMLGMTRPNTCTYLAKLQEAGFIATEPGTRDKRMRYHSLTSAGREHMDGWQFEDADGRGTSSGYKSHVASNPGPVGDSEEVSVEDLLEDCGKIVYDNELSGEVVENMSVEF